MFRNGFFGIVLAALTLGPACADPTGTYRAWISRAEGGPPQTGRVTVSRRDESYRVVWTLNGRTITGVGLGGAFNRGDLVIGPAHRDDLMLVVGYRDGDDFGSATMILQVDGSYQGYRVSNGSGAPTTERWTPLR